MSKTKYLDTKERILEEGSRVFVAKSYNGCGLNEILKAAGVPKGSFYHYFKSKEDFGVAVIERSGHAHLENMRRLLNNRSESPLTRIRHYFEWMRDHYRDSGLFVRECLISKFAVEVGQLSEPMRIAVKYSFDSWATLLAKTIREAQQAGEIRDSMDAEKLANILNNLWEGASIRMQIERSIDPFEEFLELVFETPFLN